MQTFLSILIMLAILGVLISIHEAGHLAAAKMFKVYCFEYSIGFGPKLLHVRRKGGETYFSIRAIPLGGYVSMYGEPGAVPEGEEAPAPERALNAIHKGKKAIILTAGVAMNFLLGLVLIFISDIAFPKYYIAYGGAVTTSLQKEVEVDYVPLSCANDVFSYIDANKEAGTAVEDYFLALPTVVDEKNNFARVIDPEVKIFAKDGTPYMGGATYAAIYYPSTLTAERDIGASLTIMPIKTGVTPAPEFAEVGLTTVPDFSASSFQFTEEGSYVEMDLRVFPARKGIDENGINNEWYSEAYQHSSLHVPTRLTYREGALVSSGARVRVIEQRNDWNQAWAQWAKDVPEACTAIGKGFISLFTPGGLEGLSGIVGMTSALPQIEALGGPGHIFYFAGLLSINLAFFNLLPFPGLDGWQLLVTIIEGITRKKMPEKAQAVATVIGFTLLALLMILVTVKDIIALF